MVLIEKRPAPAGFFMGARNGAMRTSSEPVGRLPSTLISRAPRWGCTTYAGWRGGSGLDGHQPIHRPHRCMAGKSLNMEQQ